MVAPHRIEYSWTLCDWSDRLSYRLWYWRDPLLPLGWCGCQTYAERPIAPSWVWACVVIICVNVVWSWWCDWRTILRCTSNVYWNVSLVVVIDHDHSQIFHHLSVVNSYTSLSVVNLWLISYQYHYLPSYEPIIVLIEQLKGLVDLYLLPYPRV